MIHHTPLQTQSIIDPANQPPARLNASNLVISLTKDPKPVPPLDQIQFGKNMTDHMLVASYDPLTGWSAPEIKPYGPFTLMPASSCFQYATNAFEGMKAYVGQDGSLRLFRPQKNMARFARSAARVALPPFDPDELLKLIKKLVSVDRQWVPAARGYSLYIRPMIVGTCSTLNLSTPDSALLWVMCAPAGPFFHPLRPLSLLAATDTVRAWPGGTGEHKIAINYGPTVLPHHTALAQGYDQNLWLVGDTIAEAGFMNFFVALKRDEHDGGIDLLTPPLDGTILPGVTRESVLALAAAHPERMVLPHLAPETRLSPAERTLTMPELVVWLAEGRVLEIFAVGTAVVVAPIGRIRWKEADIVLPTFEGGLGSVGRALYERIIDIQEGRYEWEGWSVPCE